jgi:hypothetical protein
VRILRTAIVTAVVALLLGTGASPAAASPEPWKPYRSEPWTAPAGKYCTFPLRLEIVADQEQVRVDARYPDGSVRVEEYKGLLIVEFVNVDTGERIRRDVSGHAWVTYRPDGSWESFSGVGPFGHGFRAGDDFPQGYYVLNGVHTITYDVDGTRRMPVAVGTEENVCEPLAP